MHPYAIQTWWGEAIGALAQDKDDAQVGSLVRLDLKKCRKKAPGVKNNIDTLQRNSMTKVSFKRNTPCYRVKQRISGLTLSQ